jgi:hypothetical protein
MACVVIGLIAFGVPAIMNVEKNGHARQAHQAQQGDPAPVPKAFE